MKLITVRSQIKNVPLYWFNQYVKPGIAINTGSAVEVHQKLLALDLDTCSAEDVAAIIGNASWACEKRCHECGVYCNTVVEVGEEPDYESATCCLCMTCCKKALEAFL